MLVIWYCALSIQIIKGEIMSIAKIKEVVIHCSATPNGRHHTAEDIHQWHKERDKPFDENARIIPKGISQAKV